VVVLRPTHTNRCQLSRRGGEEERFGVGKPKAVALPVRGQGSGSRLRIRRNGFWVVTASRGSPRGDRIEDIPIW